VSFRQIPRPVTRVRTPKKSALGGFGAFAVDPKIQTRFQK
jgi:hypothetical protein